MAGETEFRWTSRFSHASSINSKIFFAKTCGYLLRGSILINFCLLRGKDTMSRLDKVANIALILACALFIGHLARNYFTSQGADPNLQPDIKIGEVVSLPGS